MSTTPTTSELMARPVLSVSEVCSLSGLGLSTVRRAIDAGDLSVHRIGRRVLIPTAVALAWLTGAEADEADEVTP